MCVSVRNFLLCLCFLYWFSLSGASLYNSTDDVEILDHSNFSAKVHGAMNAWIIEFYNTWCGHCIQFAPTWKQFGTDVRDWKHTVKVGVLDCAADDNVPICREHEIMAYPTIKFFAARTSKGDIGSHMPHVTSVKELREAVIDFLVEKQKARNGSKLWANLQPYQSAEETLLEPQSSNADWIVLVIDRAKSYVARAVLLDLAAYSSILVRYKEAEQEDLERFGSTGLPAVTIMSKNGMKEILGVGGKSRNEIRMGIIKKLVLSREILSGKKSSSMMEDKEGAGDGQPEEINKDKLNYGDDLPDAVFAKTERSDQVFMVDIENAVSYAIRHELAQHKIIKGERLLALQEFLYILAKYLPARPQLLSFLSMFHQYSLNHEDAIGGTNMSEIINSLQIKDSVLPSQKPWVGCAGSKPIYRGYPCGLWTTFHVLTVNSVLQEGTKRFYDPLRTVKAIHGYIKYFFGCSYCSEHFQAMYAEDAETTIQVSDDTILWLWRAHNKVNKRIAGSDSEDPQHPKQQFPPSSLCPSCWHNEKFIIKEVLSYLKEIYAKGALSFRGTQAVVEHPRNRQEKIQQLIDVKHSEILISHQNKMNMEKSSQDASSWSFTNADISLCVFLYGASTIIIMAVYCSVVIRRKMRRKKFVEVYKLT